MKAQFILLGAAIAAGLLFAVMGTISVANIAAQTGDGMSPVPALTFKTPVS